MLHCRNVLVLLLIFAELWDPGVEGARPEDKSEDVHAGSDPENTTASADADVAKAPDSADAEADAEPASSAADDQVTEQSPSSDPASVPEQSSDNATEGSSEDTEATNSKQDQLVSNTINGKACDVGEVEPDKLQEFVEKVLACAKQRQTESGTITQVEKANTQDLEKYRSMVSTVVTKLKDKHGHGEGLTGPFETDHTRNKVALKTKIEAILSEVEAWKSTDVP